MSTSFVEAIYCPGCSYRRKGRCSECNLQFHRNVLCGLTCYTVSREQPPHEELEKQRTVAEAVDRTVAFLKLQLPLKPSRESDTLSRDVTILVRGADDIRAHRFILADKSPVFRSMLDCEMKESKTGVITIDDASYAAVHSLVQYCYTAEIRFTEDVRADEVLKIAHKYQILHLRDRCAKQLCGTIAKENLIEMMTLSRDYEVKELQEALAIYLLEHFHNVFPIVLEAV